VGDVVLAGMFGLFVFVLLNVVSLGLLVTLATVAGLFLVFGLAHYLIWGRTMQTPVTQAGQPAVENGSNLPYAVELTEDERLELICLLELSLPLKRAMNGNPADWSEPELALRRTLLDRLRLFGA
jgi:hypothetical protein